MRKNFQLGRDDKGDIHNRQPEKKILHQTIIQIPKKKIKNLSSKNENIKSLMEAGPSEKQQNSN